MNSSSMAAKRLKKLLAADRADVSAAALASLKADILEVSREYFAVNEAASELVMDKSGKRGKEIALVCRIVLLRAK